MIRMAVYSPALVFPNIIDEHNKKATMIGNLPPYEGKEFLVNVASIRLQCFKKSLVCSSCGRVGNCFALEKSSEKDISPHLNLYCLQAFDEEVLMTHDHILPKSKGGQNHISNVQTMCVECNVKKDNVVSIDLLENLKKLIAELLDEGMQDRDIFNYIINANMQTRIGFQPTGGDFVAIIREFIRKGK